MRLTRNLFLIGFMGVGKTSVSAAIQSSLATETVEMDACIVSREGMAIKDIFETLGEPYFRACETALLLEFQTGAPRVVSCGGGVAMWEENVTIMRKSGVIVLLTATPETILERVKDSTERPLLNGHMDAAYIAQMMAQRRPKYEAAAEITVDTSVRTVDEVCRMLLEEVKDIIL